MKNNRFPNAKIASKYQQWRFFKHINLKEPLNIEQSGVVISKISKNYLLYDPSNIHTLVIGTTASGKSRKHAMIVSELAIAAKENIVFNDCKKEFYQQFKAKLEQVGYQIILIDLRNLDNSDGYNPLDTINQAYTEHNELLMDLLINDLVQQLVHHHDKVEPIWENGERALIKGLILLVVRAPIDIKYKNLYTVSKVLKHLITPNEKSGNLILEDFLKIVDDPAIIEAFKIIQTSSDSVRLSLITSALTTLDIYGYPSIAKVITKSSFTVQQLVDDKQPTALFVVNPDEKETFDSLTALIYQQIYTQACAYANQLTNKRLNKRLNFIFDEFGNMEKIKGFTSMISVARSRNIIFYLYLQDFAQIDQIYGQDQAQVIRANCNCWIFIGSSDTRTCQEVANKIGHRYLSTSSFSHNRRFKLGNHGHLSHSYQKIELISANELMQSNNLSGKKCIVMRTYFPTIIANLPDISKYPFPKVINQDKQPLTDDIDLDGLTIFPYIYSYELSNEQNISFIYWAKQPLDDLLDKCIKIHLNDLENIYEYLLEIINEFN